MKVLVGSFTAESNMFAQKECNITDFDIVIGEEMLPRMYAADLFAAAGIELVPTILADGVAAGYIEKESFDYIAAVMLKGLRQHLGEIDGIFLFLHGASHVNGLEGDSGEHYLLREMRRMVGPHMPIAVAMDPHGNVSAELCQLANIVRGYRHSPHTDIAETYRAVAAMLIELLQNRRAIHPVYHPVPILIGGERCVSHEEPLSLINRKLDEAERSDKILSASYHVGFAWADSPLCSAGVVVVPAEPQHSDFARQVAEELADFAFERRRDFHFTGNAMPVEQAIATAFSAEEGPVVMSDSGDNTTAGALGYNTVLLRRLLAAARESDKRVLVCTIHDKKALGQLAKKKLGEEVQCQVGIGIDADSPPVELAGTVVAQGVVNGITGFGMQAGLGRVATVRCGAVDVAVADNATSFAERQQFAAAGLDLDGYDIVVVKQGYLFPELQALAKLPIMALTSGATYQLTEEIDYKTIPRPMFPVDDI